MKRTALIVYLLALHVLLAFAIARPGTVRQWLGKPDPFNGRMERYLAAKDATAPDGAAIFLGDSITQSLAVAAVSPNAVNLGFGSQTTADLTRRVRGYRSLERASVIYLLIGANDLRHREPDYDALLRELPADVPLVWSGVMPSANFDPTTNNARIRALCAARPKCRYVDTSWLRVPQDFTDGAHPNAASYRKWAAQLRDRMRPRNPDVAAAAHVLTADWDQPSAND